MIFHLSCGQDIFCAVFDFVQNERKQEPTLRFVESLACTVVQQDA
jgi:hypothetical protein